MNALVVTAPQGFRLWLVHQIRVRDQHIDEALCPLQDGIDVLDRVSAVDENVGLPAHSDVLQQLDECLWLVEGLTPGNGHSVADFEPALELLDDLSNFDSVSAEAPRVTRDATRAAD